MLFYYTWDWIYSFRGSGAIQNIDAPICNNKSPPTHTHTHRQQFVIFEK
jgi:hypothetical protein